MTKNILLTPIIVLLTIAFSWGQTSNDYLLWSSRRKLSVDDFSIKTKQHEATPSFAQFTVGFQVNGFDFLTKNFNKKVKNYFIKGASWIDTTVSVQQSLIYQQTLFDICEVYTRRFRQALKDNRKKITKGTAIVEELNKQFTSEFAKRRLDYDRQTNFGADVIKQSEWENQIQKELAELADYAYEK